MIFSLFGRITKPTFVILFLIVMLLGGCQEGKPLVMPSVDDINVIKVSTDRVSDKIPINTITDRQKINKIVAFVNRINSDWYRPLDTYPTPQLTIWFEDSKGKKILVLWLGPDWLGAMPEPVGPLMGQLHKLDENDVSEFRKLLGV